MDIILEGPDGAGKTTLFKALEKTDLYHLVPRASTSIGGPVPNLAEWVTRDFTEARRNAQLRDEGSNLWRPGLYDRHPMISELIYGVIVRRELKQWFDSPSFIRLHTAALQRRAVIVFCMPPFNVVKRNLQMDPSNQMDGVLENIQSVYLAYTSAANMWPGRWINYDYTVDRQDRVLRTIERIAYDKENTL